MKYWQFIPALTLAVAAGCGDDSADTDDQSGGSSNGGADSGGSGGSGGTAGAAGVPGDAGAPSLGIPCEPGDSGACRNEADCPVLESGSATETAVECGTCVINADPPACWQTCLGMGAGLSEACTTCFAEFANCSFENCALPCLSGAQGDACQQCQLDNGCSSTFATCSGVDAP